MGMGEKEVLVPHEDSIVSMLDKFKKSWLQSDEPKNILKYGQGKKIGTEKYAGST